MTRCSSCTCAGASGNAGWRERPRLIVTDAAELAREAGLPHPERGPLALDNLKRLGLLGDLMTDATGARILDGPTVGVVLTPFGEAFARACLHP